VVERSPDDGGTWHVVKNTAATSWTDAQEPTGVYRYRLAGVAGGVTSDWSAPSAPIAVDDNFPTRPAGLDAGPTPTAGPVRLGWRSSTDVGGPGEARLAVVDRRRRAR
jgi:hypothetical protein